MLSAKFGIDLGTVNSIVYVKNKGIVMEEPTVVAVEEESQKVLNVGIEAKKMLGRTPEGIVAVRPLRNGVIADYEVTQAYLNHLMGSALGRSRFTKPDVVVSIPSGATSVEARAVIDVVYNAGARRVFLVPEPLAAAIGAGLPVSQASGNMVVNIGGGTTETAVVSLYGIVVHGSVRVGGLDFDSSISQHIRRKYNLSIGESTAERVKIDVGNAAPLGLDGLLEIKGRDSVSGFPRIIEVSTDEINQCLIGDLHKIGLAVKSVLERTPPELSADILDKGIVLSGGTALMKNMDKYLSDYVGVPFHVAEDPLYCVINGLGQVIDHLDRFSKSMIRR